MIFHHQPGKSDGFCFVVHTANKVNLVQLAIIQSHANSQKSSSTFTWHFRIFRSSIRTLLPSHARLCRVKPVAVLESISTRRPKSFGSHERGIHWNLSLLVSRICWHSSCKVNQYPDSDTRRCSHSYCGAGTQLLSIAVHQPMLWLLPCCQCLGRSIRPISAKLSYDGTLTPTGYRFSSVSQVAFLIRRRIMYSGNTALTY